MSMTQLSAVKIRYEVVNLTIDTTNLQSDPFINISAPNYIQIIKYINNAPTNCYNIPGDCLGVMFPFLQDLVKLANERLDQLNSIPINNRSTYELVDNGMELQVHIIEPNCRGGRDRGVLATIDKIQWKREALENILGVKMKRQDSKEVFNLVIPKGALDGIEFDTSEDAVIPQVSLFDSSIYKLKATPLDFLTKVLKYDEESAKQIIERAGSNASIKKLNDTCREMQHEMLDKKELLPLNKALEKMEEELADPQPAKCCCDCHSFLCPIPCNTKCCEGACKHCGAFFKTGLEQHQEQCLNEVNSDAI